MSDAANQSQRIVIVTGAGSGIGRAAALAFLADGWSVVLAGRRAEPLDAVAKESNALDHSLCRPTSRIRKPSKSSSQPPLNVLGVLICCSTTRA